MASQDIPGTDGEGIKISEDGFEGPGVRFGKGIAAYLFKADFPQHLLVMVEAAARHVRCGNAPGRDSPARPLVDNLGNDTLPRFPITGATASAHNSQAASRL